jgi:hypothetical protein
VNTHGNDLATPGEPRSQCAHRVGVSVESLVRRESGGTTVRPGGAHRRTPARGVAAGPLFAATAVAGAAAASVSSVVVLSTGAGPAGLVRDVQAAGHTTDDGYSRTFAVGATEAEQGADHQLMDGSRIAALAQLAADAPSVLASATLPQMLPAAPHTLADGPAPAGPPPAAPPAAPPNDPTRAPSTQNTDARWERPSSGSDGSDRADGSDGSGSGSHDRPRPADPPRPDPEPSPSPDPDPAPSPDPDPTPSPDPDPTPSPDPDPTPSPDPDPTPSPDPEPGDDDQGGGSGGDNSDGDNSGGGGGSDSGGGSEGGSSGDGGSDNGGSDNGGSDNGGSAGGGSSGGARG